MRAGHFAWVLLLAISGSSASAQPGGEPAELPPEGYSAREYVDSGGCVFQRSTVSGTLLWVPRMTADNKPVCNKRPTLGGEADGGTISTRVEAPLVRPTIRATPPGSAVTALQSPLSSGNRSKGLMLVEQEQVGTADTLCLSREATVTRFWISDGRRVTYCGERVADAVSFLNELNLPGLHVSGTDYSPASRALARQIGKYGYRTTWASGPLRRQVPEESGGKAVIWLQVGAFANAQNADRAIDRIRTLNFPVARLKVRGGRLTAVLVGPFNNARAANDVQDALRTSGFPEVLIR